MQPTYIPWPGYFNLIYHSDVFVLLDDAQFQKSSWHSRNKIRSGVDASWITVPVLHKTLSQTLSNTQLSATLPWRKKHFKSLINTYSKHQYFSDINNILHFIATNSCEVLADLNISLIQLITDQLSIDTKLVRSSSLNLPGQRTDRLISILKHIGATSYLSPVGARQYLLDDQFQDKCSIELKFQDFPSTPYSQFKCSDFIPIQSLT